jgi:hypothetical protein
VVQEAVRVSFSPAVYPVKHEQLGFAEGQARKPRSLEGMNGQQRWAYLNGYQYGFRLRKEKDDGMRLYDSMEAMFHPRDPNRPMVILG